MKQAHIDIFENVFMPMVDDNFLDGGYGENCIILRPPMRARGICLDRMDVPGHELVYGLENDVRYFLPEEMEDLVEEDMLGKFRWVIDLEQASETDINNLLSIIYLIADGFTQLFNDYLGTTIEEEIDESVDLDEDGEPYPIVEITENVSVLRSEILRSMFPSEYEKIKKKNVSWRVYASGYGDLREYDEFYAGVTKEEIDALGQDS